MRLGNTELIQRWIDIVIESFLVLFFVHRIDNRFDAEANRHGSIGDPANDWHGARDSAGSRHACNTAGNRANGTARDFTGDLATGSAGFGCQVITNPRSSARAIVRAFLLPSGGR